MQFQHILRLIVVLSFGILLGACGGSASNEQAEAINRINNDINNLTQIAEASVSGAGIIATNYPEGWTAQPVNVRGVITLFPERNSTQTIIITYVKAEDALALAQAAGADVSPNTVVITMGQPILATQSDLSYGEVVDVQIGSYAGAQLTATGGGITNLFYALQLNDGFAFVQSTSAEAIADEFKGLVEAISATITYGPRS